MMTLQEFETGLYHRLYDFFGDHEFEMMAGLKQFRRLTPHGFQNVIFSPTAYEDELWLDLNIGLRYSPVEDLAQQFLDNLPQYRHESNTLIISVGKFHKNKYFRYKVANEEDLKLCCEQIRDFLKYTGFGFLQKYNALPQLDKLINHKPARPCPYMYNQVHRCFKGLIAARLNDSRAFMDLAETYRKYLKVSAAKPGMRNSFEKLSQYLLHYSSN